jgi:4-amino-4-deoxy-L-arabinose transferase-like glycosyltransferase
VIQTDMRARHGRIPWGRVRVSLWLRRVPRAAWICALVAFLNATAWALITPPFQGKDEIYHFSYVEHLAVNGSVPDNVVEKRPFPFSTEEGLVIKGLDYLGVQFSSSTPSLATEAEQRALLKDVDAGAARGNSRGAGIATPEPPLYYAIQVIPYELGGGNILLQLQLMRVVGTLFGALTALLVFLFVRECLPRVPWAAAIGALCVALQPLFGFMSGILNPETMLFAIAAALFLCLARAFRRGLTRRLALAFGLLIAVGFMTKLNFAGLAFGVFAGLVVLSVREARSRGWEGLRLFAIAAGVGVAPLLLYALRNLLAGRPALGIISGAIATIEGQPLLKEISYMWELYLPRLPGMTRYFPGIATFKDIWFDRSVGLYGWMDTTFPGWVENLALVPAVAIALLCARELFARRGELRARAAELCVYVAMTLGVLVLIGVSSYHTDVVAHELAFGEPRYLLSMLALLGAAVALAVRGAGRRWAPVVGAAMVVLFLGHDLFSQLQAIARYYG